jgi:MoxR-like ATPase
MKTKIQSLLASLNQGLVEREPILKTALLTVLAGENLVMIGPPGTGKSMVARRIVQSLTSQSSEQGNNDYFEYLLTKFSTPEEIFGPLSISELKADRFKRNTAGYLPTVRLAFLDEIFKASSSILNALLTILNERIFHNGAEAQEVPLLGLIAASNELPAGQEELGALYDRFLTRVFVDYVKDEHLHLLFEPGAHEKLCEEQKLTLSDLKEISAAVAGVSIPPECGSAIREIWLAHKDAFKEDRRERLSDRRLKKVLHLLRVAAATNGRQAVDLSDVLLLKDCLWNHPENADKVLQIILKTIRQFSAAIPAHSVAQLEAPADETIPYTLDEDGVTVVQIMAGVQGELPGSGPAEQRGSNRKATVKGYAGAGTEFDPLLIETVHDLADLARPEVGEGGYYFRQVADIDASEIATWPKIKFNGVYDGGGKTIKGRMESVFDYIHDCTVREWNLDTVGLSKNAVRSTIEYCTTAADLLGQASNCKVAHCSGKSLATSRIEASSVGNCSVSEMIAETIHAGSVTSCLSAGQFCRRLTESATISDCCIAFSMPVPVQLWGHPLSGFAETVQAGCTIERSFFAGTVNGRCYLTPIAAEVNGIIRNCAVGHVVFSDAGSSFKGRICDQKKFGTLENNISIDTNKLARGGETDGQSVAAALFTQRYFENSLGWDFDHVWSWDAANSHPVLRDAGAASKAVARTVLPERASVDLFARQMRANIWI